MRLNDEELRDLHSLSNINRVIKLRIIRLVGHVARSGKEALLIGFVWGSLWERDNVEDLRAGGKLLQKLIFKKYWNEMIWLRIGRLCGPLRFHYMRGIF